MKLFICPECNKACLYDDNLAVTHIKCISCGKVFLFNDSSPVVKPQLNSTIRNLYNDIQNIRDNSRMISFLNERSHSFGVDIRILADLANMHLSHIEHQPAPSCNDGFSIIKETEVTLDTVVEGQKNLEFKLNELIKRNADTPISITGLGEKELKRQLMLIEAQKKRLIDCYEKASEKIAKLEKELKKYK